MIVALALVDFDTERRSKPRKFSVTRIYIYERLSLEELDIRGYAHGFCGISIRRINFEHRSNFDFGE